MNFTIQYINVFLQFALSVTLILYSINTNKQLEQSRVETNELKEQVSLLLQQATTE